MGEIPPIKIIRKWKDDGVPYVRYWIPPKYDESHLIISKNKYGIRPTCIRGMYVVLRFLPTEEDPLIYLQYLQKKRQKLSGKRAFIYALIDPITKTPFYVGSTKGKLTNRLSSHMADRDSKNKRIRIERIIKKGLRPIIVQLCECPVEFITAEERRWIHGARRIATICNIIHNN